MEDLADALDAVGDLLLAESVHQLVAGNPLRAGLAADTLGRGGEVPDTFHTLTTPHRARALTHRIATLLPATPSGSTGWPSDAIAELAPDIEAWVAHLLGPADGWTIEVGDGTSCTVDRLGMGALATVLDASATNPRGIRRGFVAATAAPADTAVVFDGSRLDRPARHLAAHPVPARQCPTDHAHPSSGQRYQVLRRGRYPASPHHLRRRGHRARHIRVERRSPPPRPSIRPTRANPPKDGSPPPGTL